MLYVTIGAKLFTKCLHARLLVELQKAWSNTEAGHWSFHHSTVLLCSQVKTTDTTWPAAWPLSMHGCLPIDMVACLWTLIANQGVSLFIPDWAVRCVRLCGGCPDIGVPAICTRRLLELVAWCAYWLYVYIQKYKREQTNGALAYRIKRNSLTFNQCVSSRVCCKRNSSSSS